MSLAPRKPWLHHAAVWVLSCAAFSAFAQGPVAGVKSVAKSSVPAPVIEPALRGECVAEPAFMRRNHPELLKHQRDETVHRGVREPKSSLKGCIDCHASKTTGSVAAAKTDFCASCHSFAAVKIDCFECHSTKPQRAATLSSVTLPAEHGASWLARLSAPQVNRPNGAPAR